MKRIKLMKALVGIGTLSVLGIGTAFTVASCSCSPSKVTYKTTSNKNILKYGENEMSGGYATLTTVDSNGIEIDPKTLTYEITENGTDVDPHNVQIKNLNQVILLENPNVTSEDITILTFLNSDLNTSISSTKITIAQADFLIYELTSTDIPAEETNTAIYKDNSSEAALTLHKVIDLKKISKLNDNVTWFELMPFTQDPSQAALDCAIFIPSDFSCHLVGTSDSDIETHDQDSDHLEDFGIVIGNDKASQTSPNNTQIDIWNLTITSELTDTSAQKSATADAIAICSTVNGTINILNNSLCSIDHYGHTTGSYDSAKCIDIESISVEGTVNIVGNILLSHSLEQQTFGINISEMYGKLVFLNNFMNIIDTKTWSFGLCINKTNSSTQILIENNVICAMGGRSDSGHAAICASLYIVESMEGVLTVTNNIFSAWQTTGTSDWVSQIDIGGTDQGASVILNDNVFFTSNNISPASNETARSLYFGSAGGESSGAKGLASGTNNIIFDSNSNDPGVVNDSTRVDNYTTWYSASTDGTKNVTFFGNNRSHEIRESYIIWDNVFYFMYFSGIVFDQDTKLCVLDHFKDILIVNNGIYDFSANYGDDKSNILNQIFDDFN